MSYLTQDQLAELQQIADLNDGHCDRCHRVIRIYRYPVNKQMATVLRKMRDAVDKNGKNEVNFDEIDIPYRLGSQRTKMRLHGLIKQIDRDGVKVQNTWLITKKGGDFLRGEAIPAKVVVFDNQLLGHEGGTTTIHRVMDEAAFQQENINPKEAEAYSEVREPKRHLEYDAQYRGRSDNQFTNGSIYSLKIDRLQMGNPVSITEPVETSYQNIAAFQREWKII